jgi:hypothetical protein
MSASTSASPGPRTPEGKAVSSRNAIRHGLTSISPVLPSEDQAEYDLFQADIVTRYDPLDPEETNHVAYVDTLWRLRRIPVYESRLIALEVKRIQFSAKPDQDRALYDFVSTLDPQSIETLALDRLSQSRTLINLHRQEQRLNAKLKSLKPTLDRIMDSSRTRYVEHLRKANAERDANMRGQQNELVASDASQSPTHNATLQETTARVQALLKRIA